MRSHLTLEGIKFKPCIDISLCSAPVLRIAIISGKPDEPFYEFAKKMIQTPKVVFTKTLKKSQWANTDIATGELTEEIIKLKSQNGKDIIV